MTGRDGRRAGQSRLVRPTRRGQRGRPGRPARRPAGRSGSGSRPPSSAASMSTTTAVMLSRPPASLAAATSASAACCGAPAASSGRMTSSGSSLNRPSEQIRYRSPPIGGQQPVVGQQAGVAAEGPGDDVPARVGPRLLPGDDAGQDEFLHLRVVHGQLLEAVTGQAVDARVTNVEDHQVIAARRLQRGEPGRRGAHAVRLVPLDDVPVGVLKRREHRLGEQRAQRHARASSPRSRSCSPGRRSRARPCRRRPRRAAGPRDSCPH